MGCPATSERCGFSPSLPELRDTKDFRPRTQSFTTMG